MDAANYYDDNNNDNDSDDDDFGFSDHDLDDLPTNTLQHLENEALRATQHPPPPAAPASASSLDDGDEVVDLGHVAGPPPMAAPRSQADPVQLLQRIKKLEQDKAREKRDADELRAKLQTKSGEADTLRRRHDADSRRFERQLADQQHTHGADMARLRADMEKLRRDHESAQTDSLFNQHDARGLAMGLARRPPKGMPSRPKATVPAAPSPAGTPKRVHRSRDLLGDGFDDDDVVMASPSRRDKQKTATPRQAGKRKRHAADQSPIPLPALQLSEPRSRPRDKEPEPATAAAEALVDVALLQHFRHDDGRFTLLHRLLSYPSSNGTDRILEALALHAFPSQPSKKLSSIVYDALAAASVSNVHELALRICHIILDLWKQCQTERYYAPTYLILDAMHFVLAYEPSDIAVQVAARAVPLIIAFVDLVSNPISKASKGGEKAIADLNSATQRDIASQIDVLDCLELLYHIATSCVSSADLHAIRRLWQAIPSTFTIMLLNKEFPWVQITLMLRILSTSALPASLGPISTTDSALDNQVSNEDALVNRLTNLFTETPKPVPDPSVLFTPPSAVPETEIWDLRLLVLSVLTQFSTSPHGSARLAHNRLCIGRLIKYLDYCITSLYRQPLSPTQNQKIESVNAVMKLIYHIATSNANFDIKSKLVNTLGGQHAYLVALTRLAFSEGLVLEAGIEDAVVDMAHTILDEGLSLEEGDAFGRVYSSASSV
ncbi:hypothetical protein BKA66DRAFT_515035 [Pyrenochaeta sp. MPI-SDFR-AT-0127]|nr:hypothetical protein BKA66DRAFT_515035 [Pyrenochaeta sp. MPI-SDFR-AT-0127]